MKHLIEVTKEGFRLTREYLNFTNAVSGQLESIVSGFSRGETVFISGGERTYDGGGFTQESGVIAHNGKLYHLPEGTFTGEVDNHYVRFSTAAAVDYPEQDYASEVGVTEVVFFERIASIDQTSGPDAIQLDFINRIDLIALTANVYQNTQAVSLHTGQIGVMQPQLAELLANEPVQILDTEITVTTAGVTINNSYTNLKYFKRGKEAVIFGNILVNTSGSFNSSVGLITFDIDNTDHFAVTVIDPTNHRTSAPLTTVPEAGSGGSSIAGVVSINESMNIRATFPNGSLLTNQQYRFSIHITVEVDE